MSVTFEPEREVNLDPWGMGPCVVVRLNKKKMAELRRAVAKSNNLKFKTKGRGMAPEMDLSFDEEIYWALFCLRAAPFKTDKETIETQDAELIDYIAQEAKDINSYFFLKTEPELVKCPHCGTEFDPAESEDGASETSSNGPTLNAHVTSNGR